MSKYNFAAIALIAACICGTAAVAQENRGTPEQQAACAPDAFRLCSSHIPDPTQVESCLRQRKTDLSESCRPVFESGAATASIRGK
jgi:hypothetical protein